MSSTNPAPSAETADPANAVTAAPAALPTEVVPAAAAEPLATQPDAAAQPEPAASADGGDPAEAMAERRAEDSAEEGSEGGATQPAAPAAAPRAEVSTAATGARLAELFPALFGGAPKPLKLRIQVDIQERAPGEFSKQALSAFFRRLTGATSYLVAVSRGKQRFDLDGQPAGELSEEHRHLAADELTRRRANQQARRAQEDAQREQEEAGRRQRFSLLRDFETTKLTTANFCALKGIAPEQLDGLLEQARKEAQEDAARPQRPHHRPEHGHGRPGQGPGRRDGERRDGERGPRREGGRNDGPRAEAGGRRDDRGRPQGPRGPRGGGGGGGREGGGAGGQGGAGGAGGRNDRGGPPRG
ncbi:ProQ/FINO family protein [Aquabacterium sp.]|uniref:ProQ/FINO family protein n=1 Tax=Aquabacterium sp. TaxID=1872578 RepID=UPI002489BD75|nr:ProQ/FINO family protein [Aquabacterium sp.]MDI1348913.1 ProQ/FINO family protein [Aquabacterium sp.]